MAERGTGDATSPGSTGASGPATPASGKTQERINKAYAQSSPVVPDDTGESKPSAADRFAAAMAVAKSAASSSPTVAPSPSQPGRKVRKARLRLSHIDPWSVMKTAFLLSIALGVVTVVAVAVIWSVLGAAGVWESIDSAVGDVVGGTGASFAIEDYLGTSRVLGFTMLVAVVDVVLVTVVATLGAFLYNLAAALLGGLEVTLAEDA
jgi:hypothetical protein